MKKVLLVLTLAFSAIALNNNADAQGVSQGNVIIDPYYGAPNLGKSFLKTLEENNPGAEFKTKGIGPLGLRVEYMVADRIGLGVDAIFNSNGAEYTTRDTTFNSQTMQNEVEVNNYVTLQRRLRLHLRFNYHFDISSPNVDAYAGVGAGTNNRFYTQTKNGVDETDVKAGALIPVSLRVCTGIRYYFTENIGLNAEIGLGGPLVSAGLSIKL